MKWLMYLLIAFGTFSGLATYGATEKRQKATYLLITIAIWVMVVIIANK